jgi:hypothetical protein
MARREEDERGKENQKSAQDGICLIWSGTCSKVRKKERKDSALSRLNGSNPAPSTLGCHRRKHRAELDRGGMDLNRHLLLTASFWVVGALEELKVEDWVSHQVTKPEPYQSFAWHA